MSEQDKHAVPENDELEKLRDQLLDGGFGAEDATGSADDTTADDEVVEGFLSMFGAKGDTPLKAHDWVLYLPSSLTAFSDFSTDCDLYGIVREETEMIYVLDYPQYKNHQHYLGCIDIADSEKEIKVSPFVEAGIVKKQDFYPFGLRITGSVINNNHSISLERVSADGDVMENIPIRVKLYDGVTNLFSRNTGLLESAEMLDKRAVLVGCGSVGSFVAMELARSGVGKFVLCDTDTLEIHNICRHQCGFDDLGRYKVDAVKDKILNINPNAEVLTYRSIIQRVSEDELLPLLGRNTIIIGGGDNRGSADWACKLAIKTDSTFVSTCCWTRAFAGEIFYWASGRGLSCYSCALGGLIDDERPESHATYFGSDEEKESLSFEPGVAADIDFVTIIAIKLALDLLNRDNPNYTPRVINYLKQYTWVCNTNSTKIGGERAGIFPTPLWITNNLSVHKDENCPYCGNSAAE